MNVGETLQKAIEDLRLRLPEVESAAVVTVEGLIIAASENMPEDQFFIGGAIATAMQAGERIAAELDRGAFLDFFIRGGNGYVLITRMGEDRVLALMAAKNAKLGMMFLEASRLASMLEEVLKSTGL